MIYMAGLGSPTQHGRRHGVYDSGCISEVLRLNGELHGSRQWPDSEAQPLWNNIDGAVIQGGLLLANVFPPCFATSPTVTIGGKAATVTYAGFVSGSVSGLYQINADDSDRCYRADEQSSSGGGFGGNGDEPARRDHGRGGDGGH